MSENRLSGGTASVTGVPAALGRRFLAYLIDALIASMIGGVVGTVLVVSAFATAGGTSDGGSLLIGAIASSALSAVWGLVFVAMQGGLGSFGMRALRLRLVSFETGRPAGFGRAFLRNIVLSLTTVILIGPFTPLFDSSGRLRGWHDAASGTWMLDARFPLPGTNGAVPPAATRVAENPGAPVLPEPSAPAAVRSTLAAFVTESTAVVHPAASEVTPVQVTHTVVRPNESRPTPPIGAPVLAGYATGAPAPATPPTPFRLVFDDASVVLVSESLLVGRDPAPRPGELIAAVHAVDDTRTMSLSKTHARFDVIAGDLSVVDRRSTNGTVVVRGEQRLSVGETPLRLQAGDTVCIGERRITVGTR
ncbi:RDD family protein [Microbacteriaceae bacterium VKM Ac-2855]|nr:RDD family protein [Microbacteriaceae bacterium VKM Ac-2855]